MSELLATRRQMLGAGGLQVLLTATVGAAVARLLGADWPGAVLMGGAVTMSSTSIAAKQLAEQGELTSRHGHLAVKVLGFQDLAAIALLALLAAWSRGGSPAWTALLGESLWTLAVFAAAALLGKPVLYRALAWVARHGSAELFLLAALLLVVAAGFGAHLLGLSPALGAFLAGLALGESDFRHRVEDDIRPFRDLLLGVFFTTVALQFDLSQLVHAPLAVAGWLLVLVPLKIVLGWPAARAALVMITFHRLTAAARIARALRHSFPNVPELAASLTEHDARELQAIAGLRVYPEKIAAGLALAEQALLAAGFSAEAADHLIARLRTLLRQEEESGAAGARV